MKDWKFDQEPNCAVITTWEILDGKPILYVFHDLDDHGWQFLGEGGSAVENAAIVKLQKIINIDPSVEEVAHIEPRWKAYRETKDSEWKIEKNS